MQLYDHSCLRIVYIWFTYGLHIVYTLFTTTYNQPVQSRSLCQAAEESMINDAVAIVVFEILNSVEVFGDPCDQQTTQSVPVATGPFRKSTKQVVNFPQKWLKD